MTKQDATVQDPVVAQMSSGLRLKLGDALDPALLKRAERLFEGENLIETILHAHMLIERAISARIVLKLAKPSILEDVQWSFHQKTSLYAGLYDPPEKQIVLLCAFNRLRNLIAHKIQEDAAAVAATLPWEGEQFARPDDLTHVRVVALMLLFDLGAVKAAWQVGAHGVDGPEWGSI
jgi:hypothetical protein